MDNFKKVLLFSAIALSISSPSYSMDSESENGCSKKGYVAYAMSKMLHPITSVKEAASYWGQTSLARTGASYIASSLSATDYINENMVNYIKSTYIVQSFVPCFVKNMTGKLYGAYHHMLEYGANYFSTLSKQGHPDHFSPKIEDCSRNHDDQDHHHHHRLTYAEVVKIGLKKYPAVKEKIEQKPSISPSKPKSHHCVENHVKEPHSSLTVKSKPIIDKEGFQLVGQPHKGSRRADCWGAPMPDVVKGHKMTKKQELNHVRKEIDQYGGLANWAKVGNHNMYELLKFDCTTR